MAALADLDDVGGRAAGVDAGEELGDEGDGVLRGGDADALRGCGLAGEIGAGGEAVLAGDEGVEALEREGEVGAALVVGDGVDLVDEDGADVAEVLAGLAGGEQDVEGLGGGDEDVGRVAEHRRAILGEGVAGADGGADLGGEVAAGEGELLDLAQGGFEVLLDVVGERLERRDVDDLRAGLEGAGDGLAEEAVDGDQKRCQGFSRAGGGGDEGGRAGDDGGPAALLRFGGGAEPGDEPLLHDGVGPGEGGGDLRRRAQPVAWLIVPRSSSCFLRLGLGFVGSGTGYMPLPMSAAATAGLSASRNCSTTRSREPWAARMKSMASRPAP